VLRAVLFDLDDTLFDHRICAQTALSELHAAHPEFKATAFAEFERLHTGLLEELHKGVMTGEVPLEYARQERFRRLFAAFGATPGEEAIVRVAETYRDAYRRIRRPIAGAAALLAAIKERVRVGIVSNNLLEEQQEKLRHCALDRFIDVLVVSEEAGVSKPDPGIFEIALERLECRAAEAVMIGDSWTADIIGAVAAGIRPIWFNPLRQPRPALAAGAAVAELHALEPIPEVMQVIFATGSFADATSPGG
jgi:YjjG family noncanonical pyrimidine nucleotidase